MLPTGANLKIIFAVIAAAKAKAAALAQTIPGQTRQVNIPTIPGLGGRGGSVSQNDDEFSTDVDVGVVEEPLLQL